MTVSEIANDLVAICKTGDFATPGEKYWADDVVSVEAGGPPGMDPVSRGKAAAAAKGEWWSNAIRSTAPKSTAPMSTATSLPSGS